MTKGETIGKGLKGVFGFCLSTASAVCVGHILITILGNIIVPASVYATAFFIDSSKESLSGGSMERVVVALVIMFILIVLDWIWNAIEKYLFEKLHASVKSTFDPIMLHRRASLTYRAFEDEETCDLVSRIFGKTDPATVFRDVVSFGGFCIRLFGIIAILFLSAWWAAMLIVVASVPLICLAVKSGKASYKVEQDTTLGKRRAEYLSGLLFGREAASERIAFSTGLLLRPLWRDEYATTVRKALNIKLRWDVRQRLGSVSVILVSFIIMVSLLAPTMNGAITIGLYISLIGYCSQLAYKMQWMFVGKINKLAKDSQYCIELHRFFSLETDEGAAAEADFTQEFVSLEFKKVYFKYPHSESWVLENLTLRIDAGSSYALVGFNGCGKSTLVKLALGLYEPTAGSVLINGKKVSEWEVSELKGIYSCVFQDYSKYRTTISDNLFVGSPLAAHSALPSELHLPDLWNGIETPIGKFDDGGIDLSGGEWQRLALYRALARPSKFLVLDEPTASLSPTAEVEFYEDYANLQRDRPVLFISHRLGMTKLVDKILVLEGGRIVQEGAWGQLMESEGLFREMFETQRKWYE